MTIEKQVRLEKEAIKKLVIIPKLFLVQDMINVGHIQKEYKYSWSRKTKADIICEYMKVFKLKGENK